MRCLGDHVMKNLGKVGVRVEITDCQNMLFKFIVFLRFQHWLKISSRAFSKNDKCFTAEVCFFNNLFPVYNLFKKYNKTHFIFLLNLVSTDK